MKIRDIRTFPVPDAPGLGVSFDEAVAAREEYRVVPQEHLRRRDGSITNW